MMMTETQSPRIICMIRTISVKLLFQRNEIFQYAILIQQNGRFRHVNSCRLNLSPQA